MHLFQIGVLLSNKIPVDLPSIIVTREDANIEGMSEIYKSDLLSLHSLDIEYDKWPDFLQPALD